VVLSWRFYHRVDVFAGVNINWGNWGMNVDNDEAPPTFVPRLSAKLWMLGSQRKKQSHFLTRLQGKMKRKRATRFLESVISTWKITCLQYIRRISQTWDINLVLKPLRVYKERRLYCGREKMNETMLKFVI